MKVTTRIVDSGQAGYPIARCYADTPIMGEVVVGQGGTEYQAQNRAARFLDANFPGVAIEWEYEYHGGDTSDKTGDLLGHYGEAR